MLGDTPYGKYVWGMKLDELKQGEPADIIIPADPREREPRIRIITIYRDLLCHFSEKYRRAWEGFSTVEPIKLPEGTSPNAVRFTLAWMSAGGIDDDDPEADQYPSMNISRLWQLKEAASHLGVTALVKRMGDEIYDMITRVDIMVGGVWGPGPLREINDSDPMALSVCKGSFDVFDTFGRHFRIDWTNADVRMEKPGLDLVQFRGLAKLVEAESNGVRSTDVAMGFVESSGEED